MQYRPNFCCECGGKIDRIEWHPWTSRRFCEVCQTNFQLTEWKPLGVLAAGLLFSLIGFAFYFQSPKSTEAALSKNLSTQSVRLASKNQSPENANSKIAELPKNNSIVIENKAAGQTEPAKTPVEKTDKRVQPTVVAETEKIYFCGAQTKKGTPCSRRVKGGGRCWQHQGMPAMLPEKDLAINQ